MSLLDLIIPKKKKSTSYYDSEEFKNKVKIEELKDKMKVLDQREEISKLQAKLNQRKKDNPDNVGKLLQGLSEGFQNANSFLSSDSIVPNSRRTK